MSTASDSPVVEAAVKSETTTATAAARDEPAGSFEEADVDTTELAGPEDETVHDHDEEQSFTVDENTNYSLFSNPPDLENMRHRLFDVKEEIQLAQSEFDQYFPFIDNVWRKDRSGVGVHTSEGEIETYVCRLKTNNQNKPVSRPIVEGKQQRRKRKREDRVCAAAIKVVRSQSPSHTVRISRSPYAEDHSHDLDYMDANKRNSGIMDIARREGLRGFLPGSVFWKMNEEPDAMRAAGGKHMKVSDVRNVQYAWRQNNLDVPLRAHTGYNQQRSGPRNRATTDGPASKPTPTRVKLQPMTRMSPRPPTLAAVRLPSDTLSYPEVARSFLYDFLPNTSTVIRNQRPHITLTWAQSLDGYLALATGKQTHISGPETKAMTHFLRSCHDGILIGVGTALADDPGLNCRLEGAGGYGGSAEVMQPRPIIIDPRGRLPISPDMRLLKAVQAGRAKGPWIVVGPAVTLHPESVKILKRYGGDFLRMERIDPHLGFDWNVVFDIFYREGIRSIMVEGGGRVLSQLLQQKYAHLVDSVIVTIAPTLFGKQGVGFAPEPMLQGNEAIQNRLHAVRWQPMGESDVVLCGQTTAGYKAAVPPTLPGIETFTPRQSFTHVNGGVSRAQPPGPPDTLPPINLRPPPGSDPSLARPSPHLSPGPTRFSPYGMGQATFSVSKA